MKFRTSFVSNSSSSSFVVCCDRELSEEVLLEKFKVPKDSPVRRIIEDIVKAILSSAKEMSHEDILDDYGVDTPEDLPDIWKKAIESNLIMYQGFFSSESDDIEAGLSALDIEYINKDFILINDGR